MKTNGSQSSHIQVDRQTIETTLDDEVAGTAVASFSNNNNENKTCSRLKRRKLNGKMALASAVPSGAPPPLPATVAAESEDLLDILDNFLITTSSNAESFSSAQQQFSSHPPQSESITNVSTPVQQQPSQSKSSGKGSSSISNRKGEGSIKFTFEEDEDEEGKQWMFCHVPGCSFWTSKSFRMQRHKLCHSEPSELEVKRCYKCPDCHLKFYSLAKLLKHDRRKHTGIKDYECRICGAEVTDIQTHMRIHADEKNHFCEHCPLSFRHKSSLVRHMFLHTGERPYRCQSCQSSFTARDRLKGHILKHHPDHPAAQELQSLSKLQQAQPNDRENNNHHKRRKRKHPCSPLQPSPSPPVEVTEVAATGAQQTLSFSDRNGHSSDADATTQPATTANIILQWPATLQVDTEGNLCWQATSLDAGTHFNEVSTVSTTMPTTTFSQILIQQEAPAVSSSPFLQHQVQNPLDVAIKEIIEVDPVELEFASQVSRFADKLRALRQQQQSEATKVASVVPRDETVFVCDKCGREYKYKSFLQVHQKRKCW